MVYLVVPTRQSTSDLRGSSVNECAKRPGDLESRGPERSSDAPPNRYGLINKQTGQLNIALFCAGTGRRWQSAGFMSS